MRSLLKIGITLSIMALSVLAFPISTAQGKSLEFPVGIGTNNIILGPYPNELKKPPLQAKKRRAAQPSKGRLPFNPCNCWSYVHYLHPEMKIGYGSARNYPVNSNLPQIGAIIITYESRSGHMGIVVSFDENNVIIDDFNYVRCGHTIRSLPLHSSLIKGYII